MEDLGTQSSYKRPVVGECRGRPTLRHTSTHCPGHSTLWRTGAYSPNQAKGGHHRPVCRSSPPGERHQQSARDQQAEPEQSTPVGPGRPVRGRICFSPSQVTSSTCRGQQRACWWDERRVCRLARQAQLVGE